MGCTIDTELQKKHADNAHQNRHGRTGTIDTRKRSERVVDQIT